MAADFLRKKILVNPTAEIFEEMMFPTISESKTSRFYLNCPAMRAFIKDATDKGIITNIDTYRHDTAHEVRMDWTYRMSWLGSKKQVLLFFYK